MSYQTPHFALGLLRCARSQRDTCLCTLRRTTLIPPKYPQRPHAYSTYTSNPHARNKTNHRIAILCVLAGGVTTLAITRQKSIHLDAPPSNRSNALTSAARIEVTGKDHGDDVDKVATGTSTVPYFPRSIWLPISGNARDEGISAALPAGIGAVQKEEQYQLLGLGVRKVSLFRIQVYVVGLYVAKSDLGKLQEELVKASVGNGASTLVQGEKEQLRKTLLDGKGSTEVWAEVLKEGGVKSAVRVVPTRNTNFAHLKDGWLRGIDLRGKGNEFEDEDFKQAVGDFKAMLGGRGSVGKGKVLLLARGADGALRAWVEEEKAAAAEVQPERLSARASDMSLLGGVKDERISRLVWMGYLAGETIASEDARQSVVEGVMELVERPIGTVETQVI